MDVVPAVAADAAEQAQMEPVQSEPVLAVQAGASELPQQPAEAVDTTESNVPVAAQVTAQITAQVTPPAAVPVTDQAVVAVASQVTSPVTSLVPDRADEQPISQPETQATSQEQIATPNESVAPSVQSTEQPENGHAMPPLPLPTQWGNFDNAEEREPLLQKEDDDDEDENESMQTEESKSSVRRSKRGGGGKSTQVSVVSATKRAVQRKKAATRRKKSFLFDVPKGMKVQYDGHVRPVRELTICVKPKEYIQFFVNEETIGKSLPGVEYDDDGVFAWNITVYESKEVRVGKNKGQLELTVPYDSDKSHVTLFLPTSLASKLSEARGYSGSMF
ncbi:MAG: hypothetical protein MHM6MM_001432 [Cercozoa sp. M6MM]